MKQQTKRKKRAPEPPICRDKYVLYEGAVQDVADDMRFMQRVFLRHRGRPLHFLREDFCGTARLAAEWVAGHAQHRALGVDLDPEPLAWAHRNHVARIGEAAARLRLVEADVRDVRRPCADAVCAFNFSYFLFKERSSLRAYFASARRGLKPDGMLFLDAFGGLAAMTTNKETRSIPDALDPLGQPVAAYVYEWEHAHFNVINHDLVSHIHFELGDGKRLNQAFVYDWRLWTLPELRELLLEAGFKKVEIYTHGWDKDGMADYRWRMRARYENEDGWLAYVVGIR